MNKKKKIDSAFISYATEILGTTTNGMTGSQIGTLCKDYAYDCDVDIEFYDSGTIGASKYNKRQAFKENILKFSPEQQYQILKTACDREQFKNNIQVSDLKAKLYFRYGFLDTDQNNTMSQIIENTNIWLADYPEVQKIYTNGMIKLQANIFQRNMLDDFRLALEILLKTILNTRTSSFVKLKSPLGTFLKDNGISQETISMYTTILTFFEKFQNEHVKHNNDESIDKKEAIFMVDITSSLMKHLIMFNSLKNEKVTSSLELFDL